jgi:hypothetical protein
MSPTIGSVIGILTFVLFSSFASSKYIVPGGRWRDTDGNLVNAHAGCITIDEATGKFWLFGEYKIQGQTEGGGVSVYSSDDLATWVHHSIALGRLGLTCTCDAVSWFVAAIRKAYRSGIQLC